MKKTKYDAQKAHEYYMKHRKLKGRRVKAKITGGKTSERKKKRREKWVAPKSAYLTTVSKAGKGVKMSMDDIERLKAKLDTIKSKAGNLSDEQKKALKKSLKAYKQARKKRAN